jgi:hypothetical protein
VKRHEKDETRVNKGILVVETMPGSRYFCQVTDSDE